MGNFSSSKIRPIADMGSEDVEGIFKRQICPHILQNNNLSIVVIFVIKLRQYIGDEAR